MPITMNVTRNTVQDVDYKNQSNNIDSSTQSSAQIIQFPNKNIPSNDAGKDNMIHMPVSNLRTRTHTQQRVSPIRDPQKVIEIYKALLSSGRYGLRNATIFILQLAIGRRTNDIAKMKIGDVYNLSSKTVKTVITVDEHKTGKTARDLPLNSMTRKLLGEYIEQLKVKEYDSLLFPSQKRGKDGKQRPLNTASLDYIYQTYTATVFGEDDDMTHISTYAARKTYGYNIYTECVEKHNGVIPGTDINALQYVQSVFNHKDSMTTLRYIGAYDAPAMKLAEDIAGKYNF